MSRMPRRRESLALPQRRVMAAFAVALAAAVGVIIWLATRGDGGSATPPAATTAGPVGPIVLTAPALRVLAGSLGQPVYWIGTEQGRRYELQRLPNGSVFVRYLPLNVAAGAKRPFRTIGTYPFKGAYAATLQVASQKGSVARKVPGRWIAVYRRSRPKNVYLARPNYEYQIEVFDPMASNAHRVATSGKLRRVG